MILQAEVWWADLGEPLGSEPGFFRRPVLVVQGDSLNRSRVATVVCVPLTSTANVSQIVALDKTVLVERVGRISKPQLQLVLAGLDVVLGR